MQYISLIPTNFCSHDFIKCAKKLTSLAKLAGTFFHPLWRWFCYWETATGFQPYATQAELQEEVDEWLCTRHVNGELVGEDSYLALIHKETRQFFSEEWVLPEKLPTINDWLKRASWMRGRGGTGHVLTTVVGGKRTRTRRNKGTDAVMYSDINLKQELLQVYPQRMVVMQKSEQAKVRPVVKSDNELFRKMDFLSEAVERGLYKSTISPIFLGAKGNEDLDFSIVENLQQGLNCPLDQGNFDSHQSKASILVVLIAIYRQIFPKLPQEYRDVWATMWNSLTHHGSRVINGENSKPWINGVPSGWRWTALIDTILNIVTYRINTRLAGRISSDHFYWSNVHQGDDISFKASSPEAVNALCSVYKDCGYEVHPEKTYLSRERTEFLRRSYEVRRITGYIGRTLGGMRFRNPTKLDPVSRPARVYERISIYLLAVLRSANPAAAMDMLIEDASQYGIPKDKLVDFALTPNAVGGYGMYGKPGGCASWLSKLSTGQWVTYIVKTENKHIQVDMGAWKERMRGCGLNPKRIDSEVMSSIAQSWGIPPATLCDDVQTDWVYIPFVEPLPIEGGFDLPQPSLLWNDELVPTMLRMWWKKQAIETNILYDYIKPEYHAVVKKLEGRVSGAIFREYLLGLVPTPSPANDQLGLKYGESWKRVATQLTLRALSTVRCNQPRLIRKLLWIENIGKEYQNRLTTLGIFAL